MQTGVPTWPSIAHVHRIPTQSVSYLLCCFLVFEGKAWITAHRVMPSIVDTPREMEQHIADSPETSHLLHLVVGTRIRMFA
jgi:hypothetical protein